MEYGLIGEKLTQSFSKEIHESIGGYNYQLYEIRKENLSSFMNARNFKAINVTIPYKKEVIQYLDFQDDSVKEIGACNTIINKNNKLYGYNTDYLGLMDMIEHFDIDCKGKRCAILGTGGTSNTANYVLKKLGASEIIKVSRYKKDDAVTYDELYLNHSDTDIILNTTPYEMYPEIDNEIINLDKFKSLYAVIDCVYNPIKTSLILKAKDKHIKYTIGIYMLIAQAFHAIKLFNGYDFKKDDLNRFYESYLYSKENIVLIGMPGSGKSTLGKALNKAMGKPLRDTDKIIEYIIKMPIKEYFKSHTEDEFRDIEESVIKKYSSYTGMILSTGGGVILRKNNIQRLRHNSVIFFIDRPLGELKMSDSRPLSSNKDDLSKRYAERYDLYLKSMDYRIDGSKNLADKVNDIMEALNK